MIIAEIEQTLWGEKYTATICEHMKEVFELALKYELSFIPDYLHDDVECSKCGARSPVDAILDWIERNGSHEIYE